LFLIKINRLIAAENTLDAIRLMPAPSIPRLKTLIKTNDNIRLTTLPDTDMYKGNL
jgi:hypothetical protein